MKYRIITIFLLLFSCVSANAQTNWVGEYSFGEDSGKTVGGSAIYIEHTLKITNECDKLSAHLYSQGFQTSKDIYADVKVEGKKLMLYFREKGEDDVRGDYQKGDLLLTLEIGDPAKILTFWGKFQPSIEENLKSGEVYFKKANARKVSNGDKPLKSPAEWNTYQTENNEFSISFPKDMTYFLDKEGFLVHQIIKTKVELKNFRSFTAYQNGVSMWMEIFDVEDGKKVFPRYLNWVGTEDGKVNDFGFDQFNLRQVVIKKEDFTTTLYHFHSRERIYTIGVASKEKTNKTIVRLLTSVDFGGKKIFNSAATSAELPDDKVIIEKLAVSPFKISYVGKPADDPTSDVPEDAPGQYSVKIISRPSPEYSPKARKANYMGEVKLDVLFGSDGQIKEIDVIKDLEFGLTEEAIIAARRIKFFPAEKDGEPINIITQIPYSFTIY